MTPTELKQREKDLYLKLLIEQEKQKLKKDDPLSFATLLPWQEESLKKPQHTQIILGSNRSGKTEYGAIVTAMLLEGRHPWQTEGFKSRISGNHEYFPMPPHLSTTNKEFIIRIIMPDLDRALKVIIGPKLQRYIAPRLYRDGSFEKSFIKKEGILYFADGAMIQFMSNNQRTDTFSGTSLVLAWHDEQPKEEVWHESVVRTIDQNGMLLITASLNMGVWSWVNDMIDDVRDRFKVNALGMYVRRVTMKDNIFLDQQIVHEKAALLSDNERAIKIDGDIGELALVYDKFKDTEPWVVKDFDIPDTWTLAVIIDYHSTKPICLQHWAVDPDNNYYIFREDTIDERGAENIVQSCFDTFGDREYMFHKIETRGSASRDRLRNHGKSAFEMLRDVGWPELDKTKTKSGSKATICEAGALALNTLLTLDPTSNLPRLRIFSSCVNTRKDLRRLKKRKSRNDAQYADAFDDTKFDWAACARVGAYEELWYVEPRNVNKSQEQAKDRPKKRTPYGTGY